MGDSLSHLDNLLATLHMPQLARVFTREVYYDYCLPRFRN